MNLDKDNIIPHQDKIFLDEIEKEHKKNQKDVYLYIWIDNEEACEFVKDTCNECIKLYRILGLKYQVITYAKFEFNKLIGIDTYNNPLDNYEVLKNGFKSRNSCVHFKDNDKSIFNKIYSNIKNYDGCKILVHDDNVELYEVIIDKCNTLSINEYKEKMKLLKEKETKEIEID